MIETEVVSIIGIAPFIQLRDDPCRLRVGVDVRERGQRVSIIAGANRGRVVARLPEVARAAEHSVERHRAIPIDVVHEAVQSSFAAGTQDQMDVIRHDRIRVDDETMLAQIARKNGPIETHDSRIP
jgi:hypothetical protein